MNTDMDGIGRAIDIIAHHIAHNLPEKPRFEAIYYPDGSCGVASSQGDCHQPGIVLGYDTFTPEIGIWFCAEHWPEFEDMIEVVEDKREKGGKS